MEIGTQPKSTKSGTKPMMVLKANTTCMTCQTYRPKLAPQLTPQSKPTSCPMQTLSFKCDKQNLDAIGCPQSKEIHLVVQLGEWEFEADHVESPPNVKQQWAICIPIQVNVQPASFGQ
jgi:hypothetical protein